MEKITLKELWSDILDEAGAEKGYLDELVAALDSMDLRNPQTFHEKKVVFLRSRIREQREYIHEINNDPSRTHDRKCEIIQSARAVKMRLEMQLGSIMEQVIEQRRKASECQNCKGEGFTIEVGLQPACCGNVNRVGDCCNNPIPEEYQYQETCKCKLAGT